MNKVNFLKEFNDNGYVILDSGFSKDFIDRAREALMQVIYTDFKKSKVESKEDYREFGLLLCSAIYGNEYPVFFEFFENDKFLEPFEWVLGKWYITYIYSSACIAPDDRLFTSGIHVDLPRIIKNYHQGVGAILCVDDFTEENGATWLLPKSHNNWEKPNEEYFYKNSKRLIAKAGTVCYFNPRLWHAAGHNKSKKWRLSLNIGMSKPWMKQRIDIPRFMKSNNVDISKLPQKTLQLLGYFSQPPASFDEFFAPKEERPFKQPFI